MISHGRVLKSSVVRALQDADRFFHDPVAGRNLITTTVISVGGLNIPVNKSDVRSIPYSVPQLPDCYVGSAEQTKVFEAIAKERKNQDDKWGEDKPQSLPGFLLILESELNEAKLGWTKNLDGKSAPLNEIVQLAATAVACLEKYGTSGSAIATDDIPNSE